jgi:hypothetical protein
VKRLGFPLIWLVCLGVLFVEIFNPYGWAQRMFAGQTPPYRWIHKDMHNHTPGSLDWIYVGANGRECANIYRYGDDVQYVLYGWGFSDKSVDFNALWREAERECR